MGTGGGAPTAKFEVANESQPFDLLRSEAKLIVRRPDVPEVEILIEKNEFLIGRLAAEVDLVLDEDLVSRKHAVLTHDDRGYFQLKDLGSKNGITYEGRMVRRLNLLDGDVFKIGKTEMTFRAKIERYVSPPPPKEPAAPSDSVMVDVSVPLPRVEPKPPAEGSAGPGTEES
jgi:pSer/pThr/pTyr-binding forkhead associated (FHA) protein